MRRGLEIAFASGDLTWVGYAHHASISSRLFWAIRCRKIRKDLDECAAFSEGAGFHLISEFLGTQRQFALSLMGRDEEYSFEVPNSCPACSA